MPFALDQLLECSFNGISFPIANLKENLSHSLAVHARVDRDGARVEDTGLEPETFQVQACLINGLARGKVETWDALFPQTFLKLKQSFKSRETGLLIHPIYGALFVKAQTWGTELTGDSRGGCMVELSFMVTRDTDEEDADLEASSPLAIAAQAATDLESQLTQFDPPLPDIPDSPDLFDSVQQIQAAIDSVSLAADQITSLPDKVINKCDKIINAVDDLSKKPDQARKQIANSGAHAVDSASRLKEAMIRTKSELLVNTAATEFYTVPKATTLASLAKQLKNKPEDLIKLNPFIAATPIIPANSVVRYYTKPKKG